MISQKMYGVREITIAAVVALALLLVGASTTFAQTAYTPPGGYSRVGADGIYYNPTTGVYYNPMTGQTSNLAPVGPAQRDVNGNYIVGSGYNSYSGGGYFNSATGYYYDPTTGFYSTTVPINTGVSQASAIAGPGGIIITPGLPNPGAGGEAAKTFAVLVVSALVVATGVTLLRKQQVA